MKLYTREQILEFLEDRIIFDSDDLESLTPIELPSDEEVNDEWEVGHSDYQNGCNYGAKWMRDKIGGNL